jgi:hypothetical protein
MLAVLCSAVRRFQESKFNKLTKGIFCNLQIVLNLILQANKVDRNKHLVGLILKEMTVYQL